MNLRVLGFLIALVLPLLGHAQSESQSIVGNPHYEIDTPLYTRIKFSEGFEGWSGQAILKAEVNGSYDLAAFEVHYRFRPPGRGPGEERTVLTLAREDIADLKITDGKLLITFTIPKFYLLERMPYRFWGYKAELSLNLDLTAQDHKAAIKIGTPSDGGLASLRQDLEDIPETNGLKHSYLMKIDRVKAASCVGPVTGGTGTPSKP